MSSAYKDKEKSRHGMQRTAVIAVIMDRTPADRTAGVLDIDIMV